MVGDLNLGTVGNRKHTYFFVWPFKIVATKIGLKLKIFFCEKNQS